MGTPEEMAHAALLRFRPEQAYTLTSLGQADGRAVFRANPTGKGRAVVVKIGTDRAAVARQFRRQRQVWRGLQDSGPSVPRPMALDDAQPVFIMEHITGASFRDLWSDDTAPDLCTRAGEWLAAFHSLDLDQRPFATAPMLRWLDTLVSDPLRDARARLNTLAAQAEGQPAPHATIHGDFHSGNLMRTTDGHTVGLDFENTKFNLTLRDLFLFLTNAALRGPIHPGAFLQAYGPLNTSPEVLRFAEAYLATATAARAIITGQKGPKMQARMTLLLPIAMGEDGLLTPG